MTAWIALLAEGEPQQTAPNWSMALPFVVMGLMLVLFFRASSKEKRRQKESLAALKKNDKVVTSGGILGVVVSLKENEDEVTLRVDDSSNTRIRVLKSSIVRITSGDAADAKA